MEIIVHSTLPSVGGHVTVSTDPNHTVDSLITAFCIDKGIPHKKEYIIRNRDQKDLWDGDKLVSCGLENGETVFLCQKEDSRGWPRGCNQWLLIALVTLLIGALGLAAMTVIRINQSAQPVDYGVIIDSGSSHSQLFVYQWDADKQNGTGIVEQIFTCKANGPGISNYTDNPQQAGESLKPCLDKAVKQVPDKNIRDTPIFLGATAGMRLVRDSGDNETSEKILNSVRSVIKTYPFHFNNSAKQVRIIGGAEEGSYSWVTANYLADTFGDFVDEIYNMITRTLYTKPTYGALDMGGASTQITFIPENASEIVPGYSNDLMMFGIDYKVYTHSYLCYGLNEAYRQYLAHLVKTQFPNVNITSPCGPAGNTTTFHYKDIFEAPCTNGSVPNITEKNTTYTFIGESNDTSCAEFVFNNLFNFTAQCKDKPCSFNGVYQPELFGKFYAFSGFYYSMNFLNRTTGSLEEFEKATSDLCLKNYTEYRILLCSPSYLISYGDIMHWFFGLTSRPLLKIGNIKFKVADYRFLLLVHKDDPMFLIKYCFNAHYVHTLLVDGYKFTNESWKNIIFKEKIQNSDLGWSLGFMLNATNRFPVRLQNYSFSVAVFVILLLLFIFFILLGLCFCYHAAKDRKKNNINRYKRMSYGALVP